jgi:hypothetical protein
MKLFDQYYSILFILPDTYFAGMNLSVDSQSATLPSLEATEEKPVYRLGLAGLLFLWAVFSVVTALVLAAIFVPGHLGLNDWLRVLGNLWPVDSPMFTT